MINYKSISVNRLWFWWFRLWTFHCGQKVYQAITDQWLFMHLIVLELLCNLPLCLCVCH